MLRILTAALALGAVWALAAEEKAPELKVGDKAPEFRLTGTDGKEYSLEQFRGKSAVVLVWYPKAMTPG